MTCPCLSENHSFLRAPAVLIPSGTGPTLSKRKAAASLALRSLKNAGLKPGVYHESFPLFGDYRPPDFDLSHFGK